MYNIEFNDISSEDVGIKITKRPSIPSPKMRKKFFKIPGRSGSLVYSEETYDDILIKVAMNFISTTNDWGNQYRKVKNWLLASGKRLKFSDDPLVFYKVKNVIINDLERSARVGCEFKAEFTCDPFTYFESGLSEYPMSEVTINNYSESRPVYKIKGEGMCTLTVNGKMMTANVGQNLTIDTELMIAYRSDGILQNTAVKGNYSDLYLKEGKNSISITSGFQLRVIPNWRCL